MEGSLVAVSVDEFRPAVEAAARLSVRGGAGRLIPLEVSASRDGLVISGTDGIHRYKERLGCSAPAEFRVAVSARALRGVASQLADGPVSIRRLESGALRIASGGAEFTLLGLAGSEAPEAVEVEALGAVNAGDLLALIDSCAYACSTDAARVNINQLLIEVGASRVTAVATDGHRMALARMDAWDGLPDGLRLTIPVAAALEIRRLLRRGGTVGVSRGEKSLVFSLGGATLRCRVGEDSQFPPYEPVMRPGEPQCVACFEKDAILRALAQASVTAPEKTNTVEVSVAEKLVLTASNTEAGTSRVSACPRQVSGRARVGVNAKYLREAIDACPNEGVQLGFGGELEAISIRPSSDGEGLEYRAVVMPMRV